ERGQRTERFRELSRSGNTVRRAAPHGGHRLPHVQPGPGSALAARECDGVAAVGERAHAAGAPQRLRRVGQPARLPGAVHHPLPFENVLMSIATTPARVPASRGCRCTRTVFALLAIAVSVLFFAPSTAAAQQPVEPAPSLLDVFIRIFWPPADAESLPPT